MTNIYICGYIGCPPGITKCPHPPLACLLGASRAWLFVRHLSCWDAATFLQLHKDAKCKPKAHGRPHVHVHISMTNIKGIYCKIINTCEVATTHGRHTSFMSTAHTHTCIHIRTYQPYAMCTSLYSWQRKSSSINTQGVIWWPFLDGSTFA